MCDNFFPATNTINRRFRKDKLFTTVKIDSKQDVSAEGVGSLIVDGGAVINKGLRLGVSDTLVPGVINYCQGTFFGFDDCRSVINLGIKCLKTEVEIEGYASLCPDNPSIVICDCACYTLFNNCLEIWGDINRTFRPAGRIMIPFNVDCSEPIYASIQYSRQEPPADVECECLTDLIPSPDNFTKPMIFDPKSGNFAFFLEDIGTDVFLYSWRIKARICIPQSC